MTSVMHVSCCCASQAWRAKNPLCSNLRAAFASANSRWPFLCAARTGHIKPWSPNEADMTNHTLGTATVSDEASFVAVMTLAFSADPRRAGRGPILGNTCGISPIS